jgi:hypothetical protein
MGCGLKLADATEFPKMITGWRSAFESPSLPFIYVELCTEYGAEEPKEKDFWEAQRAAAKLSMVDYACAPLLLA